MKRAALFLLLLSSCATTTGSRTSNPREIAGWPDWLCLEFPGSGEMSYWYLKTQAPEEGRAYKGSCDSWARKDAAPIAERPPQAPAFKILGGKGRATLLLDDTSAEAALTILELDPGAQVAEHEHEGSAEILFLKQGSVEMKIAGRRKSARAGDVIHIPAGVKHSAKVAGDVMVKAVQVYTPPGPEQRFRKGERIR